MNRHCRIAGLKNLNRAGALQRTIGAVLIDRLKPSRGNSYPHVFLQFRHPDPMLVQVRSENPGYVLGNVAAHATLLLRHTAAMNDAAASCASSGDLTNL